MLRTLASSTQASWNVPEEIQVAKQEGGILLASKPGNQELEKWQQERKKQIKKEKSSKSGKKV